MVAIVKSAPCVNAATDRTIRSQGLATITIHDLLVLWDNRKIKIPGLGELNAEIHGNVCTFLEQHGVPTYYLEPAGDSSFEVDVLHDVPFTIVVRTHATGRYSIRHPEYRPRERLGYLEFEFFLHRGDKLPPTLLSPGRETWVLYDAGKQVSTSSVVGIIHRGELAVAGRCIDNDVLGELRERSEQIFLLLADAWRKQKEKGVLTTLALHFGYDPEANVFRADGIMDNHCWDVWRNGTSRDDVGLRALRYARRITAPMRSQVLERTRWVAEITRRFLDN